MQTAILTFDGFNEIDTLFAAHVLNRVDLPGWGAYVTAPTPSVTSMNGVEIAAQRPLEFANEADAVIVGSGRKTREVVADDALMSRLRLDPERQYVASQCSGVLVLMRLGIVRPGAPVCTDRKTQSWVEADGFEVLDGPFHARGRVATAGGCFAAQYLATWLVWSRAGRERALEALSYALPHGEEDEYAERAVARVEPFVAGARAEAVARA